MAITVRGLQSLKPGKTIAADGPRGSGRLEARRTSGGVVFYFRYTKRDGSRDRIALGAYDGAGKKGLTLEAAAQQAGKLSERYLRGDRDLRLAMDRERWAEEREREAARLADEAAKARQGATLGALASAYLAQLRADRKTSEPAVDLAFKRHIQDTHATLWNKPAADVTADDLFPVISALVRAKKPREAAKLRAYLRAAYSAAIRARTDARAVESLQALKLSHNPARDLAPIDNASGSRERALSLAELRAYWKRIIAVEDPSGALLRLHLLTGGQRCEQLARATRADVDGDAKTLTLWDRKGRRREPRRHVVPLVPAAVEAIKVLTAAKLGEFVFTLTGGEAGASYASIAQRVRDVAAAMQAANELEKGPFTVGDLRRTVETRLAGAGVSRDVRAHLQSHGLGGVQAVHYDKYAYLDEKRAALETLYDLITGKKAKVVQIASAKAKAARK